MLARTHVDLHNIRVGVEKVKKVSDRLIGVGPFGLGLDGVLSFTPVAGVVYSAGAGALLLAHAVRARASPGTLVHMGVLLGINTLLDVPGGTPLGIFSGIADTFFTGHKWAADVLLRHMDDTIYLEGTRAQARNRPDHAAVLARVKSGDEWRRVVFLG